jgi:hypothetical protein
MHINGIQFVTYTPRYLRFSHSDLEADDEEFDSLNQSDSINQSDHGNHEPQASVNATGRPRLPTPTGDNPHEVSVLINYCKSY